MKYITTGLLLSAVVVLPGYADDRVPTDSTVYYQMNGGDRISEALNAGVQASLITLRPSDQLPSSCEIWANRKNLGAHAEIIVNDYVATYMDEAEGLVSGTVNIVKTAPEMIAIGALERALPAMYDWMNQMTGMVNLELEASMETCRAATQKIKGGAGILDSWTDLSASIAWRETLDPNFDYETDSSNLNYTARNIHETASSTPIDWFGGAAGASAGSPVEMTKGIISAGYGAISTEEYTGSVITAPATAQDISLTAAGGSLIEDRNTRLSQIFPDSEKAVEFAKTVLGEESIEYCKEADCKIEITPGTGLKSSYMAERYTLLENWVTLISAHPPLIGGSGGALGITNPTPAELENVSSQGVKITRQLYTILRNLPADHRTVFIYKLASDVALENTVERALALIDMVNSGVAVPEVQSYEITRDKADRLVTLAKESIENLMYEINIRKDLTSQTASLILAEHEAFLSAAGSIGLTGGRPAIGSTIIDGEIFPVDQ